MLRLLAGMPVSSTWAGANQRAVDERPPALDHPDGAAQGGPRSRLDARGPTSSKGAWAAASLVLLCYKASSGLRRTSTRPARQSLKQRASQELVRGGDGRQHMAFRPHRECPAA